MRTSNTIHTGRRSEIGWRYYFSRRLVILFLISWGDYISYAIKTELFPCWLPDEFRQGAKSESLPRARLFQTSWLHVSQVSHKIMSRLWLPVSELNTKYLFIGVCVCLVLWHGLEFFGLPQCFYLRSVFIEIRRSNDVSSFPLSQSIMIKLKFRLVLAYLLWVYSPTWVHSSNDFHEPAQSNRVLNDCKRLCRDAKTTEVPLEDSQVGVF